ncbi:MAG TPA: translation initiation factor IF-2, partial [Cyanobacteria bacterium UBA11367]|nr:translation initiation factor IF-2 [Cyanobacteria bacterium UBA11367]
IYELSRELNLDNKDILNICEGLNIAVKSHSSTITESDVQRIRAAAEKYTETPTTVKHRDSGAEGSAKSPLPHKSNRPNPQQKQQILSLKPKSRPSSSYQQGADRGATPPQAPVKPRVNPPRPPVNANRPNQANQAANESESQAVKPKPTTPSIEEKPQLVQPPSRPSSPKQQAAQVERPVLKRDRIESGDGGAGLVQNQTKSPKSSRTPSESKSPGRNAPTAPPVPKLQA